jgi:CheY-like chemotaxis protein
VARDAVRTIGLLLDDVLDTARLDAGRLELRPHEFDLHALLHQLHEAQRGVFAAKGLTLALHIAAGVPRTVHADPLRLKQVLLNLLSNAAKYTEQGGATLSAAAASNAAGAAGLELTVQDSGVGIAPALQARLFEPFVTLHGAAADVTPSSGLGLSICRRLVQLMGGSIELQSQPGAGARVLVRVPLRQPGDAATSGPLRRDGVLLLCDDDEVSRLLLGAALGRMGYTVVQAARGDQALARWRAGDVRLLLTDLRMPGLGGHALAQAIREAEAADAARGRTAIVFCSGDVPPLADAAGTPPLADAFIGKPVDLATLADTLHALLDTATA